MERDLSSNDSTTTAMMIEVFPDDICFQICGFLDSGFVVKKCELISKQWLRVIKERAQLSLSFARFGVIPVKILEQGFLFELKQLTRLDLSNNEIGDEGAKKVSELKQVTDLNVFNNNIGDEGAKFISENLKQLTKLHIAKNQIGDEGAKSISGELKQVTILIIYKNQIGDEGAKFISKMKQLTHLDISTNQIGIEGAKSISEMTQLQQHLDISYNRFSGEEGKRVFEKFVCKKLKITQFK